MDSTEDSVSSSSSMNNGAAGAGGWLALQAAAAVVEATVATVTATATTTAVSTNTTAVRRVGLTQPATVPLSRQLLRRSARHGRRRLPPHLRNLAPANESAEDADDEADDADGEGATTEDTEDDAHENDDHIAEDRLEVDEAEIDEDLRTSEESAPQPATNDDFVEFSIAVTTSAGAPASSAFSGGIWLERLLRRRQTTWRLFSQGPRSVASTATSTASSTAASTAAASTVAASTAAAVSAKDRSCIRWPPHPRRRLSVPSFSVTASAAAKHATAATSDSAIVIVPMAVAPAADVTDAVRLSPDLFQCILREATIGHRSVKGGGSWSTQATR